MNKPMRINMGLKSRLMCDPMKKILAISLMAMAALTLAACGLFNDQPDDQGSKNGTFEIYLLPVEFNWDEKVENIKCEAAEGALLSQEDILSYAFERHEIKLSPAAAMRLSEIELAGQPFVVCADQAPIYVGEFMAAFMSRSSEQVVILWPSMEADPHIIKIQLGYPGVGFYAGENPRSDERILSALEQAGLIAENPQP
jgi:hypothetical protein